MKESIQPFLFVHKSVCLLQASLPVLELWKLELLGITRKQIIAACYKYHKFFVILQDIAIIFTT